MTKDARRHHRVPWIGPVRLSWETNLGDPRFAHAKCIDVSDAGMRIECPVPIEAGARIFLNAERIKFSGAAAVRHVKRFGGKYLLGMELVQPAGERMITALREPWALRGPACTV